MLKRFLSFWTKLNVQADSCFYEPLLQFPLRVRQRNLIDRQMLQWLVRGKGGGGKTWPSKRCVLKVYSSTLMTVVT